MKFSISKNLERTTFLLVILIGSLVSVSLSLQSLLAISSTGSVNYGSAEDEIVFKDGFELGSFSKWTSTYTTSGDSAGVVTTNPYEGSYHARFQTDGSASALEWAVSYYDISSEISEIYARGYFYIADGLPLDDNDDRFGLIAIYNVDTEYRLLLALVRIVKVSGVDKFQLKMASGESYVTTVTDTIYPQEDVWYCVELYFRVNPTEGEGRVWINGIERIVVADKDTDNYGSFIQVCYGLIPIGVQHPLNLHVDAAVLSTEYVGQLYNFAVIGDANALGKYVRALNNIYWMLGNLSIGYKTILPSEVTDETVFNDVDGVISFVSNGGVLNNASAVKAFAKTHVVITHGYDFANFYHPSFSSSYVLVSNVSVTYLVNWGVFRSNDKPEMRRTDGTLGVVLASSMSGYANITKIAQHSSTHVAFFRMSGEAVNSGYYVMDLYATRNSTLRANNWHLFPAINYVRAIPVGKYARWLADETPPLDKSWVGSYSLDWVNSFMQNLANNNPELVQLYTFGTTVEGRNMYALFVGRGSRYILIDAAIHGDEKTGTVAVLRTAELLVEYYNADNSYWRNRLNDYKIVIVPVSNPDGYYANKRTNANGKDLNRNYPPDGEEQFTEPESRAFANLLGNYTPTIFINLHTYLTQMLFYQDWSSPLTEPSKTFALKTWHMANTTYTALKHWGKEEEWFKDGSPKLLGKINHIGPSSLKGPVVEYAWWKHKTISAIVEFYHASPAFNLLGQEFFCSVIFTAIQHYDRILDIQAYSTGEILTTSITANTYTMYLNTQELQIDSQSKVYVGSRGKPVTVVIDGVQKNEGDDWSWSDSSNIVSLTGVKSSVSLNWTA